MGPILFLVVLVLGWYFAYLALNWVLGPLDRAAKNRRYPIQFSLADFLCLFVQVQLALAGPSLLFRKMQNKSPALLTTALLVGLVLLVWWTGVRTLSRAGVHGTAGRAFTLVVSIPLGYTAAIATPILLVMIFACLMDSREEMGLPQGTPNAWLLVLMETLVVGLVVILGKATRRVLAAADRQREAPPPTEDRGESAT